MRLRRYEHDDFPAFAKLFGDADVMRYVGDGVPLDDAGAQRLFERVFELYATDPEFHVWAIEEAGGYAGHAELKRRTGRSEYELIYFLARDRWGRGLGGEVVDALLAFAHEQRLPFVIATVDDANAASRRILERRGFLADAALSEGFAAPAYRLGLEA
ncbi:MAG: N-acetyltransferase [Candidatus Eremiobacteraeota bacterium]|nr:N-acetyltransferase [Candidatus Eremiobacteraeota bacterium]